ncbi:MAG: Ribonuclease VapC20 [Pelotomaculum sp. PtaU1.Bin065]|nr:MAG: Ribonuclease VapC20 [Pelotomaculum sp. PtaU1.Bin065]
MEVKDLYKCFIDTGGLIALLDVSDPYHKESSAFYNSLKKSTLLFTSTLVISETYTWLLYHCGHSLANRFLGIIENAIKTGYIRSIIPDNDLINKTHAVLRAYEDQNLSYPDAMSFVIVELYDIQNIFGFDNHFYIIKRNLWPHIKKR